MCCWAHCILQIGLQSRALGRAFSPGCCWAHYHKTDMEPRHHSDDSAQHCDAMLRTYGMQAGYKRPVLGKMCFLGLIASVTVFEAAEDARCM